MCEYCEEKKEIFDKVYEDGSKFSECSCSLKIRYNELFKNHEIVVSPVEYYKGKKQQYHQYFAPISYCPICGKKLGRDK